MTKINTIIDYGYICSKYVKHKQDTPNAEEGKIMVLGKIFIICNALTF